MPVLTVIDTTGTQRYIFGSNRLRENIGASEIVARATSAWVCEVLRELAAEDAARWANNLRGAVTSPAQVFRQLDEARHIGANGVMVELIYAGGGNTLLLFEAADAAAEQRKSNARANAVEFTRRYTRRLLKDAPGLDVVVAHSDWFDMAARTSIIDANKQAMQRRVNDKKAYRRLSAPLGGLGVTALCGSTGGAATSIPLPEKKFEQQRLEKYGNAYVAAEIAAKLEIAPQSNQRLKDDIFSHSGRWTQLNLAIPLDFDDIGRTRGETSFLAVVHTDGNGMGHRIKEHGQQAKDNRDWVNRMRAMSRSIDAVNRQALQSMVDLLLEHIDLKDEDGEKTPVLTSDSQSKFTLNQNRDGKYCVPLRPVIFGGEDVAFICDGRIGLSLTAAYLAHLETAGDLPDGKGPLYGRAGVAIVKAHYPFARAYSLAEDLAQSAKEIIKEIDATNKQVNALDWHIAMSGLLGGIGEIRRREYHFQEGTEPRILSLRPLILRSASGFEERTWERFNNRSKLFQGPDWRERRSKLKDLREILRQGAEATKNFVGLYGLTDDLKNAGNSWDASRCAWFDALEALDWHFPLSGITPKGGATP
jgi:hypothetical protein